MPSDNSKYERISAKELNERKQRQLLEKQKELEKKKEIDRQRERDREIERELSNYKPVERDVYRPVVEKVQPTHQVQSVQSVQPVHKPKDKLKEKTALKCVILLLEELNFNELEFVRSEIDRKLDENDEY